MLFVTDTHALIHHITGRKRRLGRKARSTFERVKRGSDSVLVPFTVLEEVMLLSEAGKLRLPLPFRDLVISLTQADNFDLGINDMQLLLEAASLTGIKDPYDRLIVAQARGAGLPLITGDCHLLKAHRRLDDPFVIQGSAPARPHSRPPLVEVADLLPGPSMDGVVVPIDVLIGSFLLHEIGQ